MIITRSQQLLLFKTLSAACSAQGITSATEKDTYRKQIILEETGLTSLKQVNRTNEYEAIMQRLAIDAGDYNMALRFATGTERRLSHMVEVCAIQLMQLHPDHPDALAYIIGILRQAGYPGRFEGAVWSLDLTADSLMSVFQMLDTHRRRVLRRAGHRPLTFDICIRYVYCQGLFSAVDHDYTTTPRPIQIAC